LRRICEAERTEYSGLETLNRLPPELTRLTWLQSLDPRGCEQFSDLSPLAGLTFLQRLDISGCNLTGCEQLSGDLAPLAGLTSLQSLNLSGCTQISDISPLASCSELRT
jgi:internalin A